MHEQIISKINDYDTIIIHRHERPDPDAIGSQVALATLIKDYDATKNVYVVGEEEPSLTFLATMDTISDAVYDGALVIVCDTANSERISDKRYQSADYLIKIDHHPNEEPYGDLVWVDTQASSTSEMIYELFEHGMKDGFRLSQETALLLYAGIVGDTGRFRYPNTTAKTLRYTSELVKENFDQTAFYSSLYRKELKLTRLEGYVLQHFHVLDSGLGIMSLTKDILQQFDVTTSESSQLVNAFSDVEGMRAWVFFVEEPDGNIRVRLRSKGPHVNEIATRYRGGGHPLASGAKASSWEETEEIIRELDELCLQG
ncbi:DHH family phosphoesterase [Desertibacillus haloalkaliphilus]|uniref:DHH family phosphoesterase n=1 Tax=Desertibacillus haloalkaliphilus TaxID=1328930 RepID=UPI001C2725DE|nr:bifunctional oligoribonuclease/PAP phosphatase NrnA [Desertibacillus haloalkaliphilus]MBU8905169.1 bifunctional oligoribonuclease/PAP phosphatase NrnA [Desertibacillus haloalkaliphilus]